MEKRNGVKRSIIMEKGMVDHQLLGAVPKLSLPSHKFPGVLVTFDGVDGSGKTTTIETLKKYLQSRGRNVHVVKLPSSEARNLSYFRKFADDNKACEDGRVDPTALFIIMLGDRLLTLRQEIIPKLQQGFWVICDRYVFMTFAQMAAYGYLPRDMDSLISIAELFPKPDLPFITYVAASEAIRRIHMRPHEKDSKADLGIFMRFIEGLRQVAEVNGLHLILTIDMDETEDVLRQKVDLFL